MTKCRNLYYEPLVIVYQRYKNFIVYTLLFTVNQSNKEIFCILQNSENAGSDVRNQTISLTTIYWRIYILI
jgi:hypothetical protein